MICSFWLVSALAIVGETRRARELMERLVKVASPLGLFAEEFDVETGGHLGNFPQAFRTSRWSRRARSQPANSTRAPILPHWNPANS